MDVCYVLKPVAGGYEVIGDVQLIVICIDFKKERLKEIKKIYF